MRGKGSTKNLPFLLSHIINLHLPVKDRNRTTTHTRHKKTSHEQTWVEEKWISPLRFDIIFCEASALISPPVQFGTCVYFQTSRDGAYSLGVTLQPWCDSLPQIHITQSFFNEMSGVCMCFIEVKESSIDLFIFPGTDLIWYLIFYLLQSRVLQV